MLFTLNYSTFVSQIQFFLICERIVEYQYINWHTCKLVLNFECVKALVKLYNSNTSDRTNN